jgi:hypothetical protein
MKNLLCFSIIIATLGSRVGATHGIHHPTSAILWVNCSTQVPNVPGALNLTGVDLEKLLPTLHCGRLEVPMDYSRPMQADNKIEIGLAMHRPSKPRGVIFYNPGGSDAGVVVAWQLALGQTTIFDGLLDYDLLGRLSLHSSLQRVTYFANSHGRTRNVQLESTQRVVGLVPGSLWAIVSLATDLDHTIDDNY